MENYSKYTSTELLKISNEIKAKYDDLKKVIINDTFLAEELEKKLNTNLSLLDKLEKNYMAIIDEINKR